MVFRKLAAAAALLAAAAPAAAFDPGEQSASTMFYISIPLDFHAPRKSEQQWSVGLQIQGKRDYQAFRIDSSMLNAFSLNDIDAKWMIAGLVTVGAAAAVGAKDKKTSNALQQQQTQQQQAQQALPPCQRPVPDPCKK